MSLIPMKALLESGVHFGHRTQKWHPNMKPYIFTERNGIHIIDLQKTVKALEQAYGLVRDTVAAGGVVLFAGTKRQAQETIQDEATRANMPYVTTRWLGGMLTNWRTIRQRVNEMERLERMREKGDFDRLTKKEALLLTREIDRLEILFGGIRTLANLPDLLFVVDVRREQTAVHEANLLKIPVIAMVDTNCDPSDIDYVVPSNDDAIRAIKLLVGKIADAAIEGKAMRKEEEPITRPTRAAIASTEDVELSDEELLGEATLAKISVRPAGVKVDELPEAALEEIKEIEVIEVVEVIEVIEVVEESEVSEEDKWEVAAEPAVESEADLETPEEGSEE